MSCQPNCQNCKIKCINIFDPCWRYNPYFNLFNSLNASGSNCFGGYCSYYANDCCDIYNQAFPKQICHQPSLFRLDKFKLQLLVSNRPGIAANFDANLIDSWGVAVDSNKIWVANAGRGLITLYDLNGTVLPITFTIRTGSGGFASPTGVTYNNGSNFVISNGSLSAPATVLVCTKEGTINAINMTVSSCGSIVVSEFSTEPRQAYYTGITNNGSFIYVADFLNSNIDVFDANFVRVTSFPFLDPTTQGLSTVTTISSLVPIASITNINNTPPLPANMAPYNVAFFNDLIYVTYGQQDSANNAKVVTGPGLGYINIFESNGTFIRRYVSNSSLNAPWGIIPASGWYGFPPNSFVVGNYGDGFLSVFDSDGMLVGKLANQCGINLQINGLKGLANVSQFANSIYFAAGPDNHVNGLFGTITMALC